MTTYAATSDNALLAIARQLKDDGIISVENFAVMLRRKQPLQLVKVLSVDEAYNFDYERLYNIEFGIDYAGGF